MHSIVRNLQSQATSVVSLSTPPDQVKLFCLDGFRGNKFHDKLDGFPQNQLPEDVRASSLVSPLSTDRPELMIVVGQRALGSNLAGLEALLRNVEVASPLTELVFVVEVERAREAFRLANLKPSDQKAHVKKCPLARYP